MSTLCLVVVVVETCCSLPSTATAGMLSDLEITSKGARRNYATNQSHYRYNQ